MHVEISRRKTQRKPRATPPELRDEHRPENWPPACPRCSDTPDMFNTKETRDDG